MITNIDLNPLYKQKSVSDEQTVKTSDIYKIQPAKSLLAEESFKYTIKDIADQLIIPQENFTQVYEATIHNFAEFVQSLPNSQYQSFNITKGHLLLAIIRANIAVNEADNYPCPMLIESLASAREPIKLQTRAAMWQYAIFSSALLLDIGRAISGFFIETCLENGEGNTAWLPLNGAMTTNNADNTHYLYKICHDLTNSSNHKLNLLFARLIVPDYIFAWLYSEQDIFFEWLGILNDEATGSGTLHKLNMVSVRRLLNEYMGSNLPKNILKLIPNHIKEQRPKYHKDSFWKGVEFSLRGEKSQPRKAENIGLEFLAWLKEGLANQSISVNQKDSKVHISKEGVFLINPEIFLEFSQQFPKYANWQAVFKHFINLGITKYVSNSNVFQYQFAGLNESKPMQGLLIEDPKILFGNHPTPAISPEISTQPLNPIANSAIFPTPREEAVGAGLRQRLNPMPKPDMV